MRYEDHVLECKRLGCLQAQRIFEGVSPLPGRHILLLSWLFDGLNIHHFITDGALFQFLTSPAERVAMPFASAKVAKASNSARLYLRLALLSKMYYSVNLVRETSKALWIKFGSSQIELLQSVL